MSSPGTFAVQLRAMLPFTDVRITMSPEWSLFRVTVRSVYTIDGHDNYATRTYMVEGRSSQHELNRVCRKIQREYLKGIEELGEKHGVTRFFMPGCRKEYIRKA